MILIKIANIHLNRAWKFNFEEKFNLTKKNIKKFRCNRNNIFMIILLLLIQIIFICSFNSLMCLFLYILYLFKIYLKYEEEMKNKNPNYIFFLLFNV
jgi:hypothetical protein